MTSLTCPVCFDKYNVAERAPAVAPCGHSLCKQCLGRLHSRQCPVCRGRLPHVLPHNFAIIEVIEGEEERRAQLSDGGEQQPSAQTIPFAELVLTSEELGAGATGKVVVGRYKDREVAVKLMPLEGPAPARAALLREAELLARASPRCPRAVELLGVSVAPTASAAGERRGGGRSGEGGSRLALVMRRCPISLAQHLAAQQGGALPPGAVLLLAVDLLRALAEAHAIGLVAGGLKPGNVLLDAAATPLLSDSGVSRAFCGWMGPHLEAHLAPGALHYQAPEQFGLHGSGCTAAADMWGLAATLLHALVGKPPFADLDTHQIVLRVGWHRAAPELPRHLPPALRSLLRSCLRAVPDERPSAAAALASIIAALGAEAGPQDLAAGDAAEADAQAGAEERGQLPAAQAERGAEAAAPEAAAGGAAGSAQRDLTSRPAVVGAELVLLWASKHGYLREVERLTEPGTLNPNAHDKDELTALHWASLYGYTRVAVALLRAGALVDAPSKDGRTALHMASCAGCREVAEVLVRKGARLEARGKGGLNLTPLDSACHNGHPGVVALLLQSGALVDPHGKGGFTPLHWACQQGHVEVARLLLDAGASLDAKTKKGCTPLMWAKRCRHTGVAQLLRLRKAAAAPVAMELD